MNSDILMQLEHDETLSALVGNRIYDRTLPTQEPEFPAIVFQTVTSPKRYTQDGKRLATPSIQFTCYSHDAQEAQAVALALEDALCFFNKGSVLKLFINYDFGRHEPETDLYSELVEVGGLIKEN